MTELTNISRMQHGGMMAEEMALMSVFFVGPDVK
jgi:hypothetical protein